MKTLNHHDFPIIDEASPAKHFHLIWVLFLPLFFMLLGGIPLVILTSLGMPATLFYELLVSFGVTAAACFIWAKVIEGRSNSSLGLVKKNALKHLILGLALGIGLITSIIGVLYSVGQASFGGVVTESHVLQTMLIMILPWAIQGFTEELLVRGWMFPSLTNRYGLLFGIFASSTYFGFLHLGNPNVTLLSIVNILLVGVVFTLMVLYHNDLWVASGFHIGWNYALAHLVGVPVSGMQASYSILQFELKDTIITGGSFGLEGGLVCTIILLILTGIYVHLIRKRLYHLPSKRA